MPDAELPSADPPGSGVAPDGRSALPMQAAATPGSLPSTRVRPTFTGSGAEYFRIWIVNVALTVVTLGIYSAWAKVRRMQYFYRNTRLADASFDYHADPVAILRGRIVGAVLFGAYSVAGWVSPLFALTVLVLIWCVMPWLISRSLRFRAHNSSYRGLRFAFAGSTRSAYWVFLALPILTVASLLTVGPFWHQRIKRYQHGAASFGGVPFTFDAPVSGFYKVYVQAVGLGALAFCGLIAFFAVAGAVAMIVEGITGSTEAAGASGPSRVFVALIGLAAMVGYLTAALTLQAFVRGRVQNLVWNGTRLGQHRFGSEVRTRALIWLMATNFVAVVGTLGLFWPFAQVRLARYLAGTYWVEVGSFDEFVAEPTRDIDAVGEEVAGFFDFDIAL